MRVGEYARVSVTMQFTLSQCRHTITDTPFFVSLMLTRSIHEHFQVPVVSGREGCFRMCHCDGTSKLSNCRILECIEPKECRFKGKVKSKLKFSFTDVLTHLSFESCCAYFSCCVFPLSDVSAKNLIFLLIHLLTRCFRMLVIHESGNGLSLLLTRQFPVAHW